MCDLLETVKTNNIILKTYRGLLNVTSMIFHHEISSSVLEDLTFNKRIEWQIINKPSHDRQVPTFEKHVDGVIFTWYVDITIGFSK